jgi:hypothetical protein
MINMDSVTKDDVAVWWKVIMGEFRK